MTWKFLDEHLRGAAIQITIPIVPQLPALQEDTWIYVEGQLLGGDYSGGWKLVPPRWGFYSDHLLPKLQGLRPLSNEGVTGQDPSIICFVGHMC